MSGLIKLLAERSSISFGAGNSSSSEKKNSIGGFKIVLVKINKTTVVFCRKKWDFQRIFSGAGLMTDVSSMVVRA